MNTKVTKEFIIENEHGLHARPSASFVKKANEYQSRIEIALDNENKIINGKSIMELMCLSAEKGTKLTVTAEGVDAEDAIYALSSLFENKFGES